MRRGRGERGELRGTENRGRGREGGRGREREGGREGGRVGERGREGESAVHFKLII